MTIKESVNNIITNVVVLTCVCWIFSYPTMLALNYIFDLDMRLEQAFAFLVLYHVHLFYLDVKPKE